MRDKRTIIFSGVTLFVLPKLRKFCSRKIIPLLQNLPLFKLRNDLVGNKAKGRISKRVFQENKASLIFRKTNISYHSLIRTRACAY